MMVRRLLGVGLALVAGTSVSLGQVSVSYSPTAVPAGGTVRMTVTLGDEGGAGLDIVGVLFDFVVPGGLTLGDFQWLNGLDVDGAFFHTEELPRPQTAASGSSSVSVPAGGALDVCSFNVSADAGSAGLVLTILVFPEGPNSGVIEDADLFQELVITAGDSVAVTVGDGSGSGDGGSVGGGVGGGSGQGNVNQNDNAAAGNGNDNANANDNSGGSGNVNDNASGNGNGSVGDGSDVNVDNDNGSVGNGNANDSSGSGGGTGGGGGANDNSGGSGNANGNDNGTGGGAGGDAGGGGPAPTSFCGVGMIPFGLFTLLGLSVMKMHDARRRQRSLLN